MAAGQRRFLNQTIRDALMNLIVYQGDTEVCIGRAAKEPARYRAHRVRPAKRSPASTARRCATAGRCATCWCNYFGDSGKAGSAQAFRAPGLPRRPAAGVHSTRRLIIGSTFSPIPEFVDRDGKYQLTMLSHSGLCAAGRKRLPRCSRKSISICSPATPASRAFCARAKSPMPIVQKYFNKWLSTAYDLFGTGSFVIGALGLHLGSQRPL